MTTKAGHVSTTTHAIAIGALLRTGCGRRVQEPAGPNDVEPWQIDRNPSCLKCRAALRLENAARPSTRKLQPATEDDARRIAGAIAKLKAARDPAGFRVQRCLALPSNACWTKLPTTMGTVAEKVGSEIRRPRVLVFLVDDDVAGAGLPAPRLRRRLRLRLRTTP